MGQAGRYRTLIYWMGAIASVSLFLVFMGHNALLSVGFALVAAACLSAAVAMRCPRCGLGLDSQERAVYVIGYIPDADCPRCGRSRRGVWPFQFLIRPERP